MFTISRARLYNNLIISGKLYNKCRVFRGLTLTSKKKGGVVENLTNRGLLRVNGEEASIFLQGLITNDMRHLEEGARSMYAMFLNSKGRVLYDAIIYKARENDVYYIECDVTAVSDLQKHLKMYCLRRKIDIDDITNEMKVWALFYPVVGDYGAQESEAKTATIQSFFHGVRDMNNIICRDPRLNALGIRILTPASEKVIMEFKEHKNVDYNTFRYILGVGEGVADLPPGKCFPLESNGDYLHGVSFHKGCYIGQEVTARTHHTGVIRKRLMPLMFSKVPQAELKPDIPILTSENNTRLPLGKLRGVAHNFGLALLRVDQALALPEIKILDGMAKTKRPAWWPQEAPKDRITSIKPE